MGSKATRTAADIIRREASACIREARRQGYAGRAIDYELEKADCEHIVQAVQRHLHRKPTKAEWAEAGYPHVGTAHY